MRKVFTSPSSLALAISALLAIHLSASQQEFAAQYGTRLPPLPSGEGGNLIVAAPSELCVDDTYELVVRRHDLVLSGLLDVVRGPGGPSRCEWSIDGLKPGPYDAVIRHRRTGQIVATAARQEISRGGLVFMRLERTQVELDGRITINGAPPTDAMLELQASGDYRWQVPLDEEGQYHVTLDQGSSDATCLYLKRRRVPTVGLFHLECKRFVPGSQRYDRDLRIEPGLIRIIVPPVPKPAREDSTSLIVVVEPDRKRHGGSGVSFPATAGFTGEHFTDAYQGVDVILSSRWPPRVLARARVVLSAEAPVQEVTLRIPQAALTCDDGWVTAC